MLSAQNANVAIEPNNNTAGLNLSNTAGNTTEASATNPTSDDRSDSFSICFSLNLGKGNIMFITLY